MSELAYFAPHLISVRGLKIRFSSNGSQFVTSSLDGSIKIWDTINEGCIKTIENAHDDSTARLWEANSGKLILKYEGVNQSLQTTFTYNEDYVLSSDELDNTIICWDSHTGLLFKKWGGEIYKSKYWYIYDMGTRKIKPKFSLIGHTNII
ncbi:10317_t:CDS:2 [Entrophospora sp. SA101]|nr:10317_t:CDS:2 [Entrophospora sp. SA101]